MGLFNSGYESLIEFLATGGNVLVIIMGTTFFMWALIIERLMYWGGAHGGVVKRAKRAWAARNDHKSWYAHAVRERLISEANQEAQRNNGVIRALVAVTPLLGLLGTVTGMVEVFDVMATTGSSNARLMAAGISKATIPTMAGLVASLSGLIFINAFDRNAQKASHKISDELLIE
ncbi:MotA/TolQ/ExbB proton channel family protein [Hyphococcus flavus]|uniref:MotA/TolQ/ExbB proton channel family protein n=1 Tax=Hyphococcus flavus TaxID=1866326 RepID=A0AAF0CGJ3_9PROT|nr:MotA/TolQ/ExbB proton channel family protein [Hyphococcus flavus]WDI32248.1 MotA/TolQ/ExbB proton channel family protein [Hyphococcus flavus]